MPHQPARTFLSPPLPGTLGPVIPPAQHSWLPCAPTGPSGHKSAHSGTLSVTFDLLAQPCLAFLSTQTPRSPVCGTDPLTTPPSPLPLLGLKTAHSHLPIISPPSQQPD